jgi:cytochrome oxidase Cu insertion factor (SCO1/SenC/PrrC family)
MAKNRPLFLGLVLISMACRSKTDDPKPAGPVTPETQQKAAEAPSPVAPGTAPAAVGSPAPDFTLPDLDGKPVHLADYRGKVVVLEWFNPECPFVKASHSKGSLVGAADKHLAEGTVWLAVNSGAPGKQGAGAEKSRAGKEQFGLKHPILIDESGTVGKLYGAERTPHLYVIDKNGVLVYRGAVDNSPDGIGESPADGKLVRYVDEAVQALASGKALAVAETKAYGCGVKYAK